MSGRASGYVKGLIVCPNGEPLSRTEKLVALVLADSHQDRGRGTFPAVKTMAEESLMDERACRRVLASLERKGLLERRRGERQGRGQTTFYFFPELDRKGGKDAPLLLAERGAEGGRKGDKSTPPSYGVTGTGTSTTPLPPASGGQNSPEPCPPARGRFRRVRRKSYDVPLPRPTSPEEAEAREIELAWLEARDDLVEAEIGRLYPAEQQRRDAAAEALRARCLEDERLAQQIGKCSARVKADQAQQCLRVALRSQIEFPEREEWAAQERTKRARERAMMPVDRDIGGEQVWMAAMCSMGAEVLVVRDQ